jgi:Biopolymer transport protein ExbD/TolR
MNEINMVPFIDVMLVLLIIFMVSAPLMTPGVVDLPSIGQAQRQPDRVVEVILDSTEKLRLKVSAAPGAPAVADAKAAGRARRCQAGAGHHLGRQGRQVRGRRQGDGHPAEGRRAARGPGRAHDRQLSPSPPIVVTAPIPT